MNILITGAARGLGLAFTRVYLEEGHTVYAGIRSDIGGELSALTKEFPSTLHPVLLDVCDTASCTRAASEIAEEIHLIINNAAIQEKTSKLLLEENDLDECLAVFDTNSLGPLRVAKAFLPHLKKDAVIANISSEAGSIASSWRKSEFGYCMSKAALNRGSVILGEYLKERGIHVMCIHPGWLQTDMGGKNAIHNPDENARILAEYIDAYKSAENTPFFDFEGQIFPW